MERNLTISCPGIGLENIRAVDISKEYESNDCKQEEDLADRTQALLSDNTTQVVQLLINYAQSSRKVEPQIP